MADQSSIEWTEATWNPVSGCNKVSPGCKHCYAERMANRLHAMGLDAYRNRFDVTLQNQALYLPLKWKRGRLVFVNSMSDLFHEEVPTSYIMDVFDVMKEASQHQFQVLTKRPRRLFELNGDLPWPSNVWMGVSVENEDYQWRIDYLRETAASVKFLSLEPLLGPLPHLNLERIDWVIVGGESGPRARPMSAEWVTDIRDQCTSSDVPFFFKQWGGVRKKSTGRELEGTFWDQMPAFA